MATGRTASRERSERMARVVFLSPALLAVILLMAVPILYGLWTSFTNYNISRLGELKFVGFANYIDVLQDPFFLSTIKWTLLFALVAVIASVGWGMLLALALNSDWLRKTSNLFKNVFILPMMVAPVVAASIWYIIYAPFYGVFNAFLSTVGLPAVNWFGEVLAARSSLVIVDAWLTTPFCFLILLAALKGVPRDLYEAAHIEGAGSLSAFFYITLPMIRNFIALVVSMRLMDSLRIFDIIYTLTKGGPDISTETMGTYIYRTAFRYFDIGHGSASAFLLFLLVAAVTLVTMWLTRKRVDM